MVQIGDMTIQDEASVEPRAKVGSFQRDVSTAAGTQPVTGVGFRPSFIIFLVAKSNLEAFSVGVDDGTTAHQAGSSHAETASGFESYSTESIVITTATSQRSRGEVQSFDVDGFTMVWAKQGSAASEIFTIKFMAFK